jgi:hypothetical protein
MQLLSESSNTFPDRDINTKDEITDEKLNGTSIEMERTG